MSEVYDFIQGAEAEFPVVVMCGALCVSQSVYYAWRQGKTYGLKAPKARISGAVKTIFEKHL